MHRFCLFFVSTALLWTPLTAWASPTWAIFDSQRAMESTKHFKEAKAAFDKEFESRKKRFEAAQEELKTKLESLQAKKAVAATGVFDEEEKALQQQGMELQQLYMKSQRELQLFDEKLKAQLFRRLEVVVKQYADTSEVTFVIDASKVLFRKKELDVTDRVLKLYEKAFGDKPIDVEMVKATDRRGG